MKHIMSKDERQLLQSDSGRCLVRQPTCRLAAQDCLLIAIDRLPKAHSRRQDARSYRPCHEDGPCSRRTSSVAQLCQIYASFRRRNLGYDSDVV